MLVLSRLECADCIETVKFALSAIHKEGESLDGLEYKDVFDPLFSLVSNAIIVGDKKVCSIGLDCLDVLIKAVPMERLQENANKFLGLLIRVCNYRYVCEIKKA